MTFVIWILATVGSALILTQSSIVSPIREALIGAEKRLLTLRLVLNDVLIPADDDARNWKPLSRAKRWPVAAAYRVVATLAKLATCPMCSGFWLGAFWAHVFLTSPWVNSAHPRASAALWLFAAGCGGSIVSSVGVALWLSLDEAKMALGLWRYLKTPKEEPRRRVPRMMSPDKANEGAFVNWTTRAIVCSCGTVVACGQSHTMTDDCDGTTSLDVMGQ